MPKARVLAVDDQRYFRELIEGLLVEEGYEVCTAASGEEAMAWLERSDFDLVLTDLVMPGMDGTALVRAIKDRDDEQEVIMVTGVVDVETAVEAMKQGATDYILKPFDRKALLHSVDKVLQRRRLRGEHSRLIAENLEYMGELSLYERGAGLFSTLAVEPLCERIVEALCIETRAQGGVLWRVEGLGETELELSTAQGLVRLQDEPERIAPERLGIDFRALTEHGRCLIRASAPAMKKRGREEALYVPLRHASHLIGLVRLSDKLEGARFAAPDLATAEKLGSHSALALTNALRFRSLERRSFRDPITRAYTHAYFQDAARNEIQKGSRFGRNFSLLRVEVGSFSELRSRLSPAELTQTLETIAQCIGGALRSTDLLAAESENRYSALLPETHALGAALLKRRIADALNNSDGLLCGAARVRVAAVTFPSDGSQLESLESLLDTRLRQDGTSLLARMDLIERPFAEVLSGLAREAQHEGPESIEQIVRFLFQEASRHPRDRRLLFVSPGETLREIARAGIEQLGQLEQSGRQRPSPGLGSGVGAGSAAGSAATDVVLVAEAADAPVVSGGFTRVSPRRVGTDRAFVLLYGDGPAYALVAGKREAAGHSFFHSGDRALVEHLAFQLRHDLGIPVGH